MSHQFVLASAAEAQDLVSYFSRARRVNDQSARLVASDGHLLAYVGVLFPRGLLDRTPTVLGLRVVGLVEPAQFDEVVPLESLVARIESALSAHGSAGGPVTITLPASSPSLSWASITPPRDGWRRHLGVKSEILEAAARSGVAEVAVAIPDGAGEAVVQKVRAEVWGKDLPKKKGIPLAAGFAADALGFLGDKALSVHSVDNWIRLSSKSGYVLVRSHVAPDFVDEE
jgi:hypothetical protein